MAHTLLALIPLLACPLGMAVMAGVPALVHRRKRARASAAPAVTPDDVGRYEPTRQAA